MACGWLVHYICYFSVFYSATAVSSLKYINTFQMRKNVSNTAPVGKQTMILLIRDCGLKNFFVIQTSFSVDDGVDKAVFFI